MDQQTHHAVSRELCGHPVELSAGRARVVLETHRAMAADERGLVHGGFTFSLADYAAMLAVNEPTVVLASAQVRFVGPVVVGDRIDADARVARSEGRKRWVTVVVEREGTPVAEGEFVAVVPERHLLEDRSPVTPRP